MTKYNPNNRSAMLHRGRLVKVMPPAKNSPQGKMFLNKGHMFHTETTCRHATKAGIRQCGCAHRKIVALFEAKLAEARKMERESAY
jgi:hypothetical protein